MLADWWRALARRRMTIRIAAVALVCAGLSTGLMIGASGSTGAPIPKAAIPQLEAYASSLANRSGDAHPMWAKAVMTTHASALLAATPHEKVTNRLNQPVYLVLMRGKFVLNYVSVPLHAHAPTGSYLAVVLSVNGLHLMDLGLRNRTPPVALSSFGPVSTLRTR